MECSEEFVLGFIQMFDGERDPRNLLLSFSSVVIIAQNMHFGIKAIIIILMLMLYSLQIQ